jgi:peptide/nickel transport system substrate-binding protein
VFEANPDHPAGLGGPPRLERLVWRVIPENSAQLTEIRVGEVDLALQPPPADIRSTAERDGIRMVQKPSRQFSFIVWNGRRAPLDDARVRRALALAIDRSEILAGLRDGLGQPGVGPIAPFHWAFADHLAPLPFAPDSARALLAAAGIRDTDGDGRVELPGGADFELEFKHYAGTSVSRDIAEAVRADLAAVGVDVSPRPVELTTLFADVTSQDRRFDMALLGWNADFRIDLRDLFHSEAVGGPYQFGSYANPELDSLLDRAGEALSREVAAPAWHRVQEILLREQPWTVIYYQTDAFLARERVRAIDMDIRGALVNVTDWWVEPRQDAGSPGDTGG